MKKVLKQARDIMRQNKLVFHRASSSHTTDNSPISSNRVNTTPNKFGNVAPSTVYTNDMQCHLCHRTYLSKETRDKHLVTFHRIGAGGETLNLSGNKIISFWKVVIVFMDRLYGETR